MTLEAETISFTPNALAIAAAEVQQLRFKYLGDMDEEGADPEALEHYLMAIAFLEQARRSFTLARYKQSRGIR